MHNIKIAFKKPTDKTNKTSKTFNERKCAKKSFASGIFNINFFVSKLRKEEKIETESCTSVNVLTYDCNAIKN